MTGGRGGDGGDGDDHDHDDGGEHSRTSSSRCVSVSAGDPLTSSPHGDGDAARRRRAATSRGQEVTGGWGGGPESVGVGAKRGCLPIHFGRLSCSAEAELVDGSARAAEVKVGIKNYERLFIYIVFF